MEQSLSLPSPGRGEVATLHDGIKRRHGRGQGQLAIVSNPSLLFGQRERRRSVGQAGKQVAYIELLHSLTGWDSV